MPRAKHLESEGHAILCTGPERQGDKRRRLRATRSDNMSAHCRLERVASTAMGIRRLRRVVLVASVWLLFTPMFSYADSGAREEPKPDDRPDHELRLEAGPATGYGRFAICDSLSRVRYGGLGASARYRYKALATKLGGAVSAVHQHTSDQSEEDPEPPTSETRAAVDGVAQVGVDTRYFGLMGGVGLTTRIRSDNDEDDDDGDGAGLFPSGALRIGDAHGMSFRVALADTEPIGLALAAAELDYQHRDVVRVGLGARLDAFTLNFMPAAHVALPVGAHWMGLSTGAVPSEGALAWQLQLLFDLQLLAVGPE